MSNLSEIKGTKWAGTAELWLDPLGDQAVRSECAISVETDMVSYTWSYQDKSRQGSIALREGKADFTDSWHNPEVMTCSNVPNAWGLFQVQGAYGPKSNWRWRIGLSFREPTDELVLQMTNIAPWGEEIRAVRMICKRQ